MFLYQPVVLFDCFAVGIDLHKSIPRMSCFCLVPVTMLMYCAAPPRAKLGGREQGTRSATPTFGAHFNVTYCEQTKGSASQTMWDLDDKEDERNDAEPRQITRSPCLLCAPCPCLSFALPCRLRSCQVAVQSPVLMGAHLLRA